jgi:hypothetical protein
MEKYLSVSLSGNRVVPAQQDDFDHAESGHKCVPDDPSCTQFKDKLKVRVRKDKSGNLILSVTEPETPKA